MRIKILDKILIFEKRILFMNRLVIIGNGFDLAHGLPTSYGHFIDDFWRNFKDKVNTEEYKKFIYTNELYYQYYSDYGLINNFNDLKSNIDNYIKDNPGPRFDKENLIFYTSRELDRKVIFKFQNDFFKIICNHHNISNWVDIECIYYDVLKGIANSTKAKYKYHNDIKKLNEEFEDVKTLLKQYLLKNICGKYNFKIDDKNEIIKSIKVEIDSDEVYVNESYTTYFLCFNYTPTARAYYNSLQSNLYKSEINYIHGEIDDPENSSIIFGYGDDMVEDYKELKAVNNNDFLKNLKNHEYNDTDNLEKLNNFMTSNKFKVLIMGHSCGISDRYLLNQIFENENCHKIKVYYYEHKSTNNFKDLTQNISRHFNNDRLATIRIENKKKSDPLFQKIRFEEKVTDSDYDVY